MSRRRKAWLIWTAAALGIFIAVLFIAAFILGRRFQPLIREQAVKYLSDRFDSEVEIAALRIRMPKLSLPELILKRGRGTRVAVEGTGVALRRHGSASVEPLFTMRKFEFAVDLGTLTEDRKTVDVVRIDGLRITVPPRDERPKKGGSAPAGSSDGSNTNVLIEKVFIRDAQLVLLPRDRTKIPLKFNIAELHMTSAGINVAMNYDATLTIPKPPGNVRCSGSFGPWQAADPDTTPLRGNYNFTQADLGVFTGIAGHLRSMGSFDGTLSALHVNGQASVPDFRLKIAGNPVPLETHFDALVDGTNGDTVLKPVTARLGSTAFTTSGTVVKHEELGRRSISLKVNMASGQLRDLLLLAMKGSPFMEGRIMLRTGIEIPPLTGTVREKLRLNGSFEVRDGKFLRSNIQEQIDQLSRRGQGQPENKEIDEVVSLMRGSYILDDEVLSFRSLTFGVPGAAVHLAGKVNLGSDQLDLHGAIKLQAKVSQTMTGWKRWALKPVDPFFSKNGAGTFLRVKVEGSSKHPNFGLDRGRKDAGEAARHR